MASTASLHSTGFLHTLEIDLAKYKKQKTNHTADVQTPPLPTLYRSDYFTEPSIHELTAREATDYGYCSRVPNFVVGRVGYGRIRFLGSTDVRWLELDRIVNFDRNCVTVYGDEQDSPPVGEGFNKAAEVTLILRLRSPGSKRVIDALRKSVDKQGAEFISFDSRNGEWKFLVQHFSRFGFTDEEEEDIDMDDATVQELDEEIEEPLVHSPEPLLSHSHPAFLRLDPVRMQEMRMLMFPAEDEDEESEGLRFQPDKRHVDNERMRADSLSSLTRRGSPQKMLTPSVPKPPLPLLEYKVSSSDISPSISILMTGQNKGLIPRPRKAGGFKFEPKYETPVTGEYSRNIIDAALFMGRSFRVGWGPNGVLVHTGTPVGSPGTGLSSVITMEKVAVDKAARDDRNKVKEELVDLRFSSLLDLHKELDRKTVGVDVSGFKMELQKVIVSRLKLPEICRAYIGIIEKQLER